MGSKKPILLLGATGKLGSVVLSCLLDKGYPVVAIARNPEKLNIKNQDFKIIEGKVDSSESYKHVPRDIEAVILTLGHGFRTSYPIQENTLKALVPFMEEKKIKRIVSITGAALKTEEDPPSFILGFTNKMAKIVDPFRLEDAIKQQEILEKSTLNWTVVRTPVHKDGNKTFGTAGYKQPYPWQRVTRLAVANFMIDCIEKDEWIKKSPIFF